MATRRVRLTYIAGVKLALFDCITFTITDVAGVKFAGSGSVAGANPDFVGI